MKRITFVIITFCITLNVVAQDFATMKSHCIPYFMNSDGNIKCIKIDSLVQKETDSIFFPFRNIQELHYNCYDPEGYSWIGWKVILNEKENIFFNWNNDSIIIKIDAVLNESWTAYKDKNSLSVLATVVGYDTMSVIGFLDSVKTIEFKTYDKYMKFIDNETSNRMIKISKNYGIIKSINFLYFPNIKAELNYLEEFDLVGLSNPKVGLQNLTWYDVHDFNIYDELHTYYEYSDFDGVIGYLTEIRTKLTYINRQDYNDSIIYKIDREQDIFKRIEKADSISYSFKHDTIIETIKLGSSDFDKLPDELILTENKASANSMEWGEFTSKTQPSIFDIIVHRDNDSCWHFINADGCFTAYSYYKGLGGPYYKCTSTFSLGGIKNELVYYKKGNTSWGTPILFTKIDNILTYDNAFIYPNPVKENLIVITNVTDFPLTLELTDMRGVKIMSVIIDSEKSDISLKRLKKGIYLYKLSSKSRIIKSSKLLKI